jgi:hypothetical protein
MTDSPFNFFAKFSRFILTYNDKSTTIKILVDISTELSKKRGLKLRPHSLFIARRLGMNNAISPRKGCWIQYQLNLNRITQATVAKKAGCNNKMVSQFLRGCKNSEKVKRALAEVLGYSSFDQLLAASSNQS